MWDDVWPLKISVSSSDWEPLFRVQITDIWPKSRAILRFFLKESQEWYGEDAISDEYIDQVLRSAYTESHSASLCNG